MCPRLTLLVMRFTAYDLERHLLSPVLSEATEDPTLSPSSTASELSFVSSRSTSSSSVRNGSTSYRSARSSDRKSVGHTPPRTIHEVLAEITHEGAVHQSSSPEDSHAELDADLTVAGSPRLAASAPRTARQSAQAKSRHTSMSSTHTMASSTVSNLLTPPQHASQAGLPSDEARGAHAQMDSRQPSTPNLYSKPPPSIRTRRELAAAHHSPANERSGRLSYNVELSQARSLTGQQGRGGEDNVLSAGLSPRSNNIQPPRQPGDLPGSVGLSSVSPGNLVSAASAASPQRLTLKGSRRTQAQRHDEEALAQRASKEEAKIQRWQDRAYRLRSRNEFQESKDRLLHRIAYTKDEGVKATVVWQIAELYIAYRDILGSQSLTVTAKMMCEALDKYEENNKSASCWLRYGEVHLLIHQAQLDAPMDTKHRGRRDAGTVSEQHLQVAIHAFEQAAKMSGDGEKSELAGVCYLKIAQAFQGAPSYTSRQGCTWKAPSAECYCLHRLLPRLPVLQAELPVLRQVCFIPRHS